jgi:hypothetical protein
MTKDTSMIETQKDKTMLFFHYSQNNSGGGFDFDESAGITHHVVIEAASAEEADRKLVEIGGYFDGCETGMDCECCGDRWHPTSDWDAKDFPHVYGEKVDAPREDKRVFSRWMPEGKETAVHYADGRIEWHPAQ